jgi:hypothetical protein
MRIGRRKWCPQDLPDCACNWQNRQSCSPHSRRLQALLQLLYLQQADLPPFAMQQNLS